MTDPWGAQLAAAAGQLRWARPAPAFTEATKGAPLDWADANRQLAAGRLRLTELPLPQLVLRATAVRNNVEVMRQFCQRRGVWYAPHGKTSMSPELFALQLAAGAWAVTLASAEQLLAVADLRLPRVLVANEVLGQAELEILTGAVTAGTEVLLWVDSEAGAAAAADAAAVAGVRLGVMLDVGYPGGRTGVRDGATAEAVARAIAGSEGLELAGVAGFEGLLVVDRVGGTGTAAATSVTLRSYLAGMARQAEELLRLGLLPDGYLLSAGGSSAFDVVVEEFTANAPHAQILTRSGCYITHDHHMNAVTSPLSPGATPDAEAGSLVAAFELWARVLSTPEPGLAILGFGRRDAPFDYGLPVPLRTGDGRDLAGATVFAMNDQHGYLRTEAALAPGEVVVLGISHPCTAFDKWRAIPVLADDDTIIDLLSTRF